MGRRLLHLGPLLTPCVFEPEDIPGHRRKGQATDSANDQIDRANVHLTLLVGGNSGIVAAPFPKIDAQESKVMVKFAPGCLRIKD